MAICIQPGDEGETTRQGKISTWYICSWHRATPGSNEASSTPLSPISSLALRPLLPRLPQCFFSPPFVMIFAFAKPHSSSLLALPSSCELAPPASCKRDPSYNTTKSGKFSKHRIKTLTYILLWPHIEGRLSISDASLDSSVCCRQTLALPNSEPRPWTFAIIIT